MKLLSTVAPWLLLAFLGQQVSVSTGEPTENGGADPGSATPARPLRSGRKPAAHGRGKFTMDADKMQCTWTAEDVEDSVRLLVKCENPEARIIGGVTDRACQYNGKPERCPGYQSDPKGFWKQVNRAFKRLRDKVCADERALVKTGMCKRAPRDAHFKLDIFSSVESAQSGGDIPPPRSTSAGGSACTDAKKKAEENCSSSWVSVCSFFFSMLQTEDC